jgi:hypothetical protein
LPQTVTPPQATNAPHRQLTSTIFPSTFLVDTLPVETNASTLAIVARSDFLTASCDFQTKQKITGRHRQYQHYATVINSSIKVNPSSFHHNSLSNIKYQISNIKTYSVPTRLVD